MRLPRGTGSMNREWQHVEQAAHRVRHRVLHGIGVRRHDTVRRVAGRNMLRWQGKGKRMMRRCAQEWLFASSRSQSRRLLPRAALRRHHIHTPSCLPVCLPASLPPSMSVPCSVTCPIDLHRICRLAVHTYRYLWSKHTLTNIRATSFATACRLDLLTPGRLW